MSSPRNIWWSYAKAMIRCYPSRKAELDKLQEPNITAKCSIEGHGSGISKPTEQTALRQLSPVKQREYDAVNAAINATLLRPHGEDHIKLIRCMYWSKTHYNIYGAAQQIPISESTAKEWHREFVYLVAKFYGLTE